MGACLLDRDDPSRVLARTPEPILQPSPGERDGYVPNVVYSCGSMVHGRELLIPMVWPTASLPSRRRASMTSSPR
jgi:predicted GH43/DUF377 family glycosyl hydrolase